MVGRFDLLKGQFPFQLRKILIHLRHSELGIIPICKGAINSISPVIDIALIIHNGGEVISDSQVFHTFKILHLLRFRSGGSFSTPQSSNSFGHNAVQQSYAVVSSEAPSIHMAFTGHGHCDLIPTSHVYNFFAFEEIDSLRQELSVVS